MALPLKGYATFQKKGLPRACPLTHGPLGAVQDPDCSRIRVQWQEKLVQGDSEHILLVGGGGGGGDSNATGRPRFFSGGGGCTVVWMFKLNLPYY